MSYRRTLHQTLFAVTTSTLLSLFFAQNCDNTGVATQTVDVAAVAGAATFSGSATSSAFSIDLTTATSASFGGFFFNTATAFQGPGGFSSKFSLVNSGTANRGDAWEFIIAGANNRVFAAPPFGAGSASNGIAGWSRQNSLVVEFDRANSGTDEQDTDSDHISVFLSGSEQSACKYTMASGTSFGDGQTYTIWVDFSGFNTQLEVRLSTDSVRPDAAVVSCSVNIWSALDISNDYYIGLGAYNDDSSDSQATVMALSESVYISDARRPADADTCAVFDSCRTKTVNGLCTLINETPGNTCTLQACPPACLWDVSGSKCCSFVERGAWQADEVTGSNQVGDVVPCSLPRRTIVEEVPCNPSPSPSVSASASPIPSASSSPVPSASASASPQPSASPSPSASSSILPSPSASSSALPSPSASAASSLCSAVCAVQIAALSCSSSLADVTAAQAVTCINDDTGAADTCECDGWGDNSLNGAFGLDPSANDHFSNCIANQAVAVGSAHTGIYNNVYIRRLFGSGSASSSFFVENDIIDSKICLLRVQGAGSNIDFRSGISIQNSLLNFVSCTQGDIIFRAGDTLSDVQFGTVQGSNNLQFLPTETGVGGTVTITNTNIQSLSIFDSCVVDGTVTVNVDANSTHDVISTYFGTNNCPSQLFDDSV